MRYKDVYIRGRAEDHRKLIVVTGVSGSGKDYLLNKTQEADPRFGNQIQVVSFGEYLFGLLQQSHHLASRDDIKKQLSPEEVAAKVREAVEMLREREPLLLNTHVVYRQQDKLAYDPDVDRRLNAIGYTYVWADPEQIKQWRDHDTLRRRPTESPEEIAAHQNFALEVIAALAKEMGSEMRTLNNTPGNTRRNIDTIREQGDKLLR